LRSDPIRRAVNVDQVARADADDTIAYLDVVTDRDSDVSYEDVYVDMNHEKRVKGV
jgi:hypothetical protein